jgi:acetyl-CoA carboxylase carboxyltransferase component
MTSLREAMLGYDVDASEVKRLLAERPAAVARLGKGDAEVFDLERGLVGLFTDLVSLFRRRRAAAPGDFEDDASEERLITFLRAREVSAGGLPDEFLAELRVALAYYRVSSLEPSRALDDALFRIYRSRQRIELLLAPTTQILERWLGLGDLVATGDLRALLDRLARVARDRHEALADLALEVSYRLFARPLFVAARRRAAAEAVEHLLRAVDAPEANERAEQRRRLVGSPYPLFDTFAERFDQAEPAERSVILEALVAQQYQPRVIEDARAVELDGVYLLLGTTTAADGIPQHVVSAVSTFDALRSTADRIAAHVATLSDESVLVELFVPSAGGVRAETLTAVAWPESVARVNVVSRGPEDGPTDCLSLRRGPAGLQEELLLSGIHPMLSERLGLSRLAEFDLQRLPSARDVYLFRGVARESAKDERLFAFAEVDLASVRGDGGDVTELPDFERVFQEALASLRSAQALRPVAQRLHWNRVELVARRPADVDVQVLRAVSTRLAASTAGAGLEKVVLRARVLEPSGELAARAFELRKLPGVALDVTVRVDDDAPIARLSEYEQKVVRARQRGLIYPHELLRMLTADGGAGGLPPGTFTEYDVEGDELAPVARPPGQNTANVIVGVVRNVTPKFPEGMTRVVLLGDPSKNLGALAEPECRRVLAALALATKMRVPVEWFALSSGAKIAMDSGTENMDWIADALRGIVTFTQAGGEVNVVVMGINVGGQPYWNAEATMLLHTRGILVMMPESAMVLTGKRALDYSGGVSAEDDLGIGGYERIMGKNGQAQYFASDVTDALRILLRHYDHAYVHPGERFPRRAVTSDPFDRDIGAMPHGGELETIKDVFSATKNPGRKKPFHIRKVMAAAIDGDHEPLERWRDMRDAENAVVWDAHLGGYPVCLLGIESEPIPRKGPVPADGPSRFTGGTLFPLASKKVARAINAASGCRPVVVLANLSGFDGSPESMRGGQLEFGAEIGRAVVNFDGPIVFCVVSRFHGGAYVVFSRMLNPNLQVAALEGTFASVIGGAPAAGVVFAGDVDARAKADPRVKALAAELSSGSDAERRVAKSRLDELLREVRAEKVGQLAEEFDREHSVQRALRVGSLHAIVPPTDVRPWLIAAIERGIAATLREPA